MQELWFYFCLRFRHHIFRPTKFFRFSDFEKIFFLKFRFKIKMCRLFPCIPILGVFLIKKCKKKMCMSVGVKNRIATCEKCIFLCEKGYKWILALGSPKNTLLIFIITICDAFLNFPDLSRSNNTEYYLLILEVSRSRIKNGILKQSLQTLQDIH